MKTVSVSRRVLLIGAVVVLAALGAAVALGWMFGYNKASSTLAKERLGLSISVWQSLDAGRAKEAQGLLEVEISSAATEVAALDGLVADGPLASYHRKLQIIADKCEDPELRQTLQSLLVP